MLDIQKLKKLRQLTGLSFSLCKKALEQKSNDLEEALKLLRSWGGQIAQEKTQRIAKEGAIFAYVHHNHKIAALVELLCETDFVAKNQEFQLLGKNLAMQLASMPASNSEEFLNQEFIKDPKIRVIDLINQSISKFGEKITVGRLIRLEL